MKKLLLFSFLSFSSFFAIGQNNFINQDTAFAKTSDCVGGVKICIDSIKYLDVIDYAFTLDGQPYNPTTFDYCRADTNYLYNYNEIYTNGEQAPILLDTSLINGVIRSPQLFASFNQFVDSLHVWTPGNWINDTVNRFIIDYPLNDTFYLVGQVRGGNYRLTSNFSVRFTGLQLRVSPGFHKLIVNDLINNVGDTVTLRAACIQKDTARQTVNIGSNGNYCVNTSQLLGTPQSASFINLCAKATTKVN